MSHTVWDAIYMASQFCLIPAVWSIQLSGENVHLREYGLIPSSPYWWGSLSGSGTSPHSTSQELWRRAMQLWALECDSPRSKCFFI